MQGLTTKYAKGTKGKTYLPSFRRLEIGTTGQSEIATTAVARNCPTGEGDFLNKMKIVVDKKRWCNILVLYGLTCKFKIHI